jgi:quinol monooxygenase YgiN
MSNQISWQVVLVVKPDELDSFRTLTAEMVESTRGEPPGS